jgi:GST-like protein
MPDLSAFPISRKWPPRFPDRLQLYSLPTPNGVKVAIMLEETGLPYEAHRVSFDANEQMSPEFLSLNPNNKIPAIIDPNGPRGEPLPLFESGAILIYLADKRPRDRYVAEAKRLLRVLDDQLRKQAWIAGEEYSIADIATFPWIRNLIGFYEAADLVGIADFPNVTRALETFLARPAVAKGLEIPESG